MPSLKLRLASVWLPEWSIKGELERVSELTTDALLSLLKERAPDSAAEVRLALKPPTGSIEERRAAMASNHNLLIESLVSLIGEDEALALGRQALYAVGLRIGEDSRSKLGLGDGIQDLVKSAEVLYRILGIKFVVRQNDRGLEMIVMRCSLSKWYSEMTCKILSAADEGVIKGLNRRVGMKFEQRITSGFPTCMARIWVESGGAGG
jgi:hypothetical protein